MTVFPPFGRFQGAFGNIILSTGESDKRAGFMYHCRKQQLLFLKVDINKPEFRLKS